MEINREILAVHYFLIIIVYFSPISSDYPHRVQTLEQRPVTTGTTTTNSTPLTAELLTTTPLNLPTTRADLTGRVMRPPNTSLPSHLMMQDGLRTPRAQEVITGAGMEGVILMITTLSILDITVS